MKHVVSLCLLLTVWTFKTDMEHDLMKCYEKSKSIPQMPEDCTNIELKNQLYRCCYLQKTLKPIDKANESNQAKQCMRVFYNKDTILDIANSLKNDYTDVSIICSSHTLLFSYLIFTGLLLL